MVFFFFFFLSSPMGTGLAIPFLFLFLLFVVFPFCLLVIEVQSCTTFPLCTSPCSPTRSCPSIRDNECDSVDDVRRIFIRVTPPFFFSFLFGSTKKKKGDFFLFCVVHVKGRTRKSMLTRSVTCLRLSNSSLAKRRVSVLVCASRMDRVPRRMVR